MPEPPQLTPFDVEESRLYCDFLLYGWITTGEPRHLLEETNFCHTNSNSHISHWAVNHFSGSWRLPADKVSRSTSSTESRGVTLHTWLCIEILSTKIWNVSDVLMGWRTRSHYNCAGTEWLMTTDQIPCTPVALPVDPQRVQIHKPWFGWHIFQ